MEVMIMEKKPVNIGQEYEIVITGFSHQGEGIGRINNFAVFVPGAIPGETITVEIVEVKKNFAKGKTKAISLPHATRVVTPCIYADSCGGCQLQHIGYQKQLALKGQIVLDALERLGGIKVQVEPTIGMDYPWRYRNKGHFQVVKEGGKVTLGFFAQDSFDVIPASKCRLFSKVINKLVVYLEEQLTLCGLEIYNRKTKQGYLRNIMVKESRLTGEIMIIFITNDGKWRLEKMITPLIETFPQVVSIYQNINKNSHSVVLGKEFKLIRGQAYLQDAIGPYIFNISPQSFFQINNSQAKKLYDKAVEFARLTGKEKVIDAYCGTGSIAIYMAGQAKKVMGIETVEAAINDARENAQLNGIKNTEFIVAKAEEWLPQWVQKGGQGDVIVVDPPRKGCAPEVLEAIVKAEPSRVVYISCNPATLARDLRYLVSQGYEVREVQPVDMFPQTVHVECVALMSRVDE